jgi:hypothetical protein
LRIGRSEEAGLERLEVHQLLEHFACLNEGRVGKALALAAKGSFECLLAANPDRKMRPIEVNRPFVGSARDDWRDPGSL